MPELPEVERARRLAEAVAVGRRIVSVRLDHDPIVCKGIDDACASRLRGRRVEGAHRHGKYLWLRLDAPPHILFHLGMSGDLRAPHVAPLELKTAPIPGGWPPRFAKLSLTLEEDNVLTFTNARRFGRVLLRDDPRHEPPVSALGWDALRETPSIAAFSAGVRRARGTIKGRLLDQSFIAGLGNWLVDEILHESRIAPMRECSSLSHDDIDRVRDALLEVVRIAVAVNADDARYPSDWIFHRRWARADTTNDAALARTRVAGRVTFWEPERQA